MSTCCLCSSFVAADTRDFWDRPLFETANFSVMPSLGSLVEGWMLVVPKRHFLCMGALSADLWSELRDLKTVIGASLAEQYGEVCAFEHGAHAPNREVGCGVDHAHLHLVPVPARIDLAKAAEEFLPARVSWSSAAYEACQLAFSRGDDYLYVEQPLGAGRIATGDALGGQIFRKAIATQLGVPDEFNWRQYPQLHNVRQTIRKVQRAEIVLA